jgi:hypothetical protein
LEIYASLCIQGFARKTIEQSYWESKFRLMQAQWALVKNLTKATGALIGLSERKSGTRSSKSRIGAYTRGGMI